MTLPGLILRWIGLLIAVSLPFAVMGAVIDSLRGAAIGTVAGLSVAIVLGFFHERILTGMHRARKRPDGALERSLALEMPELKPIDLPEVLEYPDPAPNALVARAFGGAGTILISSGLLSVLNETELRAVLRACAERNARAAILLQSYCAVFAAMILARAPRQWVSWAMGQPVTGPARTPLSFLWFAMLFPAARFWLALGGPAPRYSAPGLPEARLKIRKNMTLPSVQRNPGALRLYLMSPWMQSNVLPL